jgi:hypothetical protein
VNDGHKSTNDEVEVYTVCSHEERNKSIAIACSHQSSYMDLISNTCHRGLLALAVGAVDVGSDGDGRGLELGGRRYNVNAHPNPGDRSHPQTPLLCCLL